ncbi:antifreeze protein [Primorskyibacter sp. 2E107]|uniref:antifreeze protein n=1 Tax=Primorskyibacter sp. 2E107 TaxID=3403458 RepID=UPI003AF9DF92
MTQSDAPDPFELLRLSHQLSLMAVEAGGVIWMRTLGMMGLWHVPESESLRMITEKQDAFAEAGRAAFSATWRGKAPGAALSAAVEPLRRTTQANSRRLSQRGSPN